MRVASLLIGLALITACTSAPMESAAPKSSNQPVAASAPRSPAPAVAARASSSVPVDYSYIRGANYCSAEGNHNDHWNHYDPKETARDLDYASKININQVRVFLSYPAYAADKEKFRRNLVDLARACQARGIGLMPVVPASMGMVNETEPYPLTREWVKELITTIGNEPALKFWDVANEPDLPMDPVVRAARIAHARVKAKLFAELDPRRIPTTIGWASERNMEANGDVVDVLSFHDYLTTRDAIRRNIGNAKAYAARVNKSLINTEIGCTGRANPYDVCIEEYTNAHIGFYMWELMITGQWGTIHGIFYPDGTIRDPSIPAAMLGLFRNRSANIIEEQPDREGRVTRAVNEDKAWLANTAATYADGLRLAEVSANLLEANQLVPMRDPPTRHVGMLRQGTPDPEALRALMTDFVGKLEPNQRVTTAPAR